MYKSVAIYTIERGEEWVTLSNCYKSEFDITALHSILGRERSRTNQDLPNRTKIAELSRTELYLAETN